jgi:hypothetical protein
MQVMMAGGAPCLKTISMQVLLISANDGSGPGYEPSCFWHFMRLLPLLLLLLLLAHCCRC